MISKFNDSQLIYDDFCYKFISIAKLTKDNQKKVDKGQKIQGGGGSFLVNNESFIASNFNLKEVNKDNLDNFIRLLAIPFTGSKINEYELFEEYYFKKDETYYVEMKLKKDNYKLLLQKIKEEFYKNQESVFNKITTWGYKFCDCGYEIGGNSTVSIKDMEVQEFDIQGNIGSILFCLIKNFYYFDGEKTYKTSIYQEAFKYKNNEEFNKDIKTSFEKHFDISYEDFFENSNREIFKVKKYSNPRTEVFIPLKNEVFEDADYKPENHYLKINPVISVSNAIYVNQFLKDVGTYSGKEDDKNVFYKLETTSIGGSKPQNASVILNSWGGKAKTFLNTIHFSDKNDTDYAIFYRLIPFDSYKNFANRRTYVKICHLNVLRTNSKTNGKLIDELTKGIDYVLSYVRNTLELIKISNFKIDKSDNFKLVNDFYLAKENKKEFAIALDKLCEGIQEQLYSTLLKNKNVHMINKRQVFFKYVNELIRERLIQYV